MKRQRLSADIRKKQILDTTYKLISEKGFKSISTRMIANNIGINEALIFKYFGNKGNLMVSIVEHIKNIRPEFVYFVPDNEQFFFDTLKKFEKFFLSLNVNDPSLLKIILYAILENYPVPDEFNIYSKNTFLNWVYNGIEKGKSLWGFDKDVDTIVAICTYMGGLIYYVIESSIIKKIKPIIKHQKFTELLMKILK